MKIQFNPNMGYQIEAINSTLDIFTGQPKNGLTYDIADAIKVVVSNELNLHEDNILGNLRFIQRRNGLKESEALAGLNFSIEMETGTGKTYVYLRTVFEFNKRYGFKKFIVVVPSVAIREGVLKTIQITREHFKEHFENVAFDSFTYDSTKLNRVRNFAVSNQIQIMIINIDSFNKDNNIFNRYDDDIQGIPNELVSSVHPILLLDEPQNMESEISKKSLELLKPLFTLRYSATHRNAYNKIYKFGAVQAYNEGMVKQIEVASVYGDSDYNGVYIKLINIDSKKNMIWAELEIYQKNRTGEKIVKKKIKVSKTGSGIEKNFDLFEASGKLGSYIGFNVDTIDLTYGFVSFSNSIKIKLGDSLGGYTQEIIRRQIRETIIEHFDKERWLKSKGIKVLSLFFIDKVANYTADDAFVKKSFVEEFEKLKYSSDYQEQLADINVDDIHKGYFATTPKGEAKDTKGNSKADNEVYQLIMKDKERLLSFNEPTRFIFSHSALREGWDNPNVFNICTLREGDTGSVIKKRQEIGRGLRICVNQDGERDYDREVNKLTIIANERYESYAKNLQTEYEDEGIIDAPPTKDRENKTLVTLRKNLALDENFKELWEKIKHKTKYNVQFDSKELIDECIKNLNDTQLFLTSEGSIGVSKVGLTISQKGIDTKLKTIKTPEKLKTKVDYIPDIISYLQKETGLTRNSIVEILKNIDLIEEIFKNPEEFLIKVTSTIKYVMSRTLIEKIQYSKINEHYEMSNFKKVFEAYKDDLVAIEEEGKGVYDYIQTDSDIENIFARELNAREDIKLFVKLPNWFKIDTPIGTYNPDWAIVKQNGEKVYMIRETKGTLLEDGLRGTENHKIHCGKEHFRELNVDYATATNAEQI